MGRSTAGCYGGPRCKVPEMEMAVRRAHLEDGAAIAAIYNQGIQDRLATFETDLRTPDDIAALLAERLPAHPAVVVESSGRIAAFAWTAPYSPRPCYAGIGEFSVYVDRALRGMGAGRLALTELISECERLGFWKLTSKVLTDNHASRVLCASIGFREVGIHLRHAQLDGAWKDVVIVERLLGERYGHPGR